ncbi:hypothetical protein LTR37_017277 [Vermiconidia calcicola]|uniref:Uncharacterized protein n=1 Tax=Vermiconidia calcicola TaxID=1690605 RepID=A0ACC3MLP7_9PEZI|nr:hypothetical protein LTR37_017277 [Vermiconidia calcicola]
MAGIPVVFARTHDHMNDEMYTSNNTFASYKSNDTDIEYKTNVTTLCLEKAKWVAHQSADESSRTALVTTILLIMCSVLVVVSAFHLAGKHAGGPLSRTQRLLTVIGVTILFACAALCFTIKVLSAMHLRYCQIPANVEDYKGHWIATGIVLRPVLLLALAEWLSVVVNVGIHGQPETELPFSLRLAIAFGLVVSILVALPFATFSLFLPPALPPAAVSEGEQHQMASRATSAPTEPPPSVSESNNGGLHLAASSAPAQSRDLEANIEPPLPPYSRAESFAPALGSLIARMRSFPPTYQEAVGRTRTGTNTYKEG